MNSLILLGQLQMFILLMKFIQVQALKKCGTPEQNKIFDACRGVKQGESWSFVFNEVGKWYYHDHLNPFWKGEIVVK
jgi:hypothetical protein